MKTPNPKALQQELQQLTQRVQQQEKALQELQRLTQLVEDQAQTIEKQALLLNYYEEQFRLLQQKRYGRKGEGTEGLEQQMHMFNEAELLAQPEEAEPQMAQVHPVRNAKKKAKEKGAKDALLKPLPKEQISYRLPDDATCPECGGRLREVGKRVRRELEVIPAKVRVKEIVSVEYRCNHCETEVAATTPQPLLRGSLVSPSLAAHVICRKYENRDPLQKISQDARMQGLLLSKQTLSNWVIRLAEDYGQLLFGRMVRQLFCYDILHGDETGVQVLHEPGRTAQQKSYMWVFCSGIGQTPVKLYQYAQHRSGEVAREFLKGYEGYLQTDGYSAYKTLGEKIRMVGCLAHVRRKFVEAVEVQPKGTPRRGSVAWKGVRYCNVLMRLDQRRKEKDPSTWDAYKQGRIRFVMQSMFAFAMEQAPLAAPKTRLSEALAYTIHQRVPLENYLLDGRLEISNNLAERAVKPFVMGRKNWLFCNTPRGAQASSVMYSIVETAKANGLKPFDYLQWVFDQMRQPIALTDDVLDSLLPWSDQVPDSCRCSHV